MRKLVSILAVALVVPLAVACGGGDDDGGGDNADAGIDAGPQIDAAPANPPVMGFGAVCQVAMNGADCVAPAQGCGSSAGMTEGVCTLVCATTPEADTAPPAGADAMCATAYSGMVPAQGTPACVLQTTPAGGNKDWLCAVLCGDLQGTDLGGCPGGLTCQMNICNP